MQKAKDIMTKDVQTIGPDATLAEVVEILLSKEISGIPVVDSNKNMIGIVTEKDILNIAFSKDLHKTKVEDVMTKIVINFPPDEDVDSIAKVISQQQFRRVPIVDNGKVIGIISRRDILRLALKIEKN
ncbi:MAG: hypothetical protein A2252_04180 [Elusimicrobia bacterium RIFOXYA2_FULL_39_19]|nr:MAG: hypothetical protein A2252_04180 [Elusimicrobia bacterium RIFOXYA2_FULL_39_19]